MDDKAPPVQYTEAADGVRIAYWKLGAGEPIIQLPALPFSHIEFEWRLPELRRGYEVLSLRRTLVRYDGRGGGLSDRDVPDMKLDSLMLDLEAAVDTTGRPAALIATMNAAPVAITFAVRHPEKVSHLMLWCPVAQGGKDLENEALKPIIWLAKNDWELYTKTMAHAFLGWGESEAAQLFAEFMRASITQKNQRLFFDTMHQEYDVLDLLPQIKCPTLVMHRAGYKFAGEGVIEDIAARIPGSEFVQFEGTSAVPYLGDWRAIARTMYGFLGITPELMGDRDRRTLRLISRRHEALTDRERDVVNAIVRGLTNREIAGELFLSEKTVENHVGRILDKLELRSRTTLAAYAVEHGIHRQTA